METLIQFDSIAPMLRAIPNLPRPVLAMLTARLIERLDEIDGDPDANDTSWNERQSQAKHPRDRLLLASEDAEMDDPPEDNADLEFTDDREVEDYEGGYSNPPSRQSRMHVTA